MVAERYLPAIAIRLRVILGRGALQRVGLHS